MWVTIFEDLTHWVPTGGHTSMIRYTFTTFMSKSTSWKTLPADRIKAAPGSVPGLGLVSGLMLGSGLDSRVRAESGVSIKARARIRVRIMVRVLVWVGFRVVVRNNSG